MPTRKMTIIKEELADVFIYALDMSVLLGLDTEKLIHDKIEKIRAKHPAMPMKKNTNDGSGSGGNKAYLVDIKHRHRQSQN